jgi:hypothetical protein
MFDPKEFADLAERSRHAKLPIGTTVNLNPIFTEIQQTASKADRTLSCRGLDDIDIGIGRMSAGIRSPLLFKREELEDFLKQEKHKDLLVVLFEKPIMWTGPKAVDETLAKFKHFTEQLGYKRVLILGANAFGTFVVDDSADQSGENSETTKSNAQ